MNRKQQVAGATAVAGALLGYLVYRGLRGAAAEGGTTGPLTTSDGEKDTGSGTAGQAASSQIAPRGQTGSTTGLGGTNSPRTRGTAPAPESPVSSPAPKETPTLDSPESRTPWLRWMVLGLSVGASLLFFFDRHRGQDRRLKARHWLAGLLEQAREAALEQLERLKHRSAGGTEPYDPNGPDLDSPDAPQSWMPDRLLKSHIQQALNGLLEQPRQVQLRVKRGFVRISGRVPAEVRDEVAHCVASVPGVVEVDNRLEEL